MAWLDKIELYHTMKNPSLDHLYQLYYLLTPCRSDCQFAIKLITTVITYRFFIIIIDVLLLVKDLPPFDPPQFSSVARWHIIIPIGNKTIICIFIN